MFAPVLIVFALLASPAYSKEAPAIVVQQGTASIYADTFQGRATASGEPHDQWSLTAASPVLPLGALVTVTNLNTGKAVQVEINDRGPSTEGRIIDLSRRAAARIGLGAREGVAPVRVEAYAARQTTLKLKAEVGRLAKAHAPARKVSLPDGARQRYGRE